MLDRPPHRFERAALLEEPGGTAAGVARDGGERGFRRFGFELDHRRRSRAVSARFGAVAFGPCLILTFVATPPTAVS